MISWLKKHFIPHADNDHRPHILRDESIRGIVAIVIFLEIFAFLIPTLTHINMTGGMAAVLPAVLSDLTNDERQAQNLQTLSVNQDLNNAATMKAEDMANYGYFAHTSPAGKTPWYWLEQVGYKYQYAGENLAINFSDSKDVANAWMASPTHEANIVKGNYTEIGTGVANGVYEGHETVFVAQVYANPLPTTPIEIEQATPIPPQIKQIVLSQKVVNTAGSTNVLGAEVGISPVAPLQQPTYVERAFASPRNTTNTILYAVFGIIFIALLLYLFIKMKNLNMGLVTNGLIVLAILGAVFTLNFYLSNRDMVITQSLDYSNQNK